MGLPLRDTGPCPPGPERDAGGVPPDGGVGGPGLEGAGVDGVATDGGRPAGLGSGRRGPEAGSGSRGPGPRSGGAGDGARVAGAVGWAGGWPEVGGLVSCWSTEGALTIRRGSLPGGAPTAGVGGAVGSAVVTAGRAGAGGGDVTGGGAGAVGASAGA